MWEVITPTHVGDDGETLKRGEHHVFATRFEMEVWLASQPDGHLFQTQSREWYAGIYAYERTSGSGEYIFH